MSGILTTRANCRARAGCAARPADCNAIIARKSITTLAFAKICTGIQNKVLTRITT
jgi:hypothetical protein